MKQHNRRGLTPTPLDPEFEVLTARPHTPPVEPVPYYYSLLDTILLTHIRNIAKTKFKKLPLFFQFCS